MKLERSAPISPGCRRCSGSAFATRNALDVAGAGDDHRPEGEPLRGDRRQPDPALRARALARPQRGLHRDDRADRAAARHDAGEPRPHPGAGRGPGDRPGRRGRPRRRRRRAAACDDGAARLRRHGRRPQHPGRRAVALRRHRHRQRRRWRRPTRSSPTSTRWPPAPPPRPTRSPRSTPTSPRRPAASTPPAMSARPTT